jgi:hypothetical protein
MFRDGVWNGERGKDRVLAWLREHVRLYDGIPRTHHVVSNVSIVAEGDLASASSYLTVLQSLPGQDRIAVVTLVAYEDAFERSGEGWVWTERRRVRRLAGELSAHIL